MIIWGRKIFNYVCVSASYEVVCRRSGLIDISSFFYHQVNYIEFYQRKILHLIQDKNHAYYAVISLKYKYVDFYLIHQK